MNRVDLFQQRRKLRDMGLSECDQRGEVFAFRADAAFAVVVSAITLRSASAVIVSAPIEMGH
jgi:hypothetical protein